MKQQKVAVLSDIHGNYLAFQACVEYALQQGVDTFFFLGDYLGEFPNPRKTLELMYAMREKYTCYFIRGNKEDYWINRRKGTNCEWKDGNHSVGAMKYCFSQLTDADIDWMETLPISQTVCLEGCEPVLICHGSPFSNREKMLYSNEDTARIVKRCEEKLIFCGHTHIQGQGTFVCQEGKMTACKSEEIETGEIDFSEMTRVYNPGAVGVPQHFPMRSCMAILTWENTKWKVEQVSVPYDAEAEIAEIHTSGLYDLTPYWCDITEHLLRTGEVPHVMVLGEVMKLDANQHPWHSIPDEYWEQVLTRLLSD